MIIANSPAETSGGNPTNGPVCGAISRPLPLQLCSPSTAWTTRLRASWWLDRRHWKRRRRRCAPSVLRRRRRSRSPWPWWGTSSSTHRYGEHHFPLLKPASVTFLPWELRHGTQTFFPCFPTIWTVCGAENPIYFQSFLLSCLCERAIICCGNVATGTGREARPRPLWEISSFWWEFIILWWSLMKAPHKLRNITSFSASVQDELSFCAVGRN